ncbi:MAG: transporter, periplasmic substrate-binding protein [Deltaproteobacteria bacterium]|nr:transporter, periplasmic substrate-binding protein [Deltaproteobacteria bacterium]
MKRSDNLRWSQVKTGLFILFAILLFCGGVLMMGDKTKMFIPKGTLSLLMSDVAGLKVGAPVWLAGVDVGLVTEIGFENPRANNQVEVVLQISTSALKKIGGDSRITIKTRGLMGEKYVDITPSQSYSDLPPTRLHGENVPRLDDVMQKAGTTFTKLNSIIEKVEKGEGTLGKLTTDKKLYDNLATLSLELKVLADAVNSGEGTLGRLVRDRELYEKMVKLADKSSLVADDMRELKKAFTAKDTTIGRLLTDDELYARGVALMSRADSAVKSFEDVALKMHTTDGTAGKLLNDQEAYDKMVKMLESVDALLQDIKENPKRYVKLSIF